MIGGQIHIMIRSYEEQFREFVQPNAVHTAKRSEIPVFGLLFLEFLKNC